MQKTDAASGTRLKKSVKMDKKLSRGITLVFVVLIMGLLAGSVSATTVEEKIEVGPNDRDVFEFVVEVIGRISAEAMWEGKAGKLALILNGPGQVGYYAREDGSSPLYLTYDVSKKDIEKGKEWRISVVNFDGGNADGFIKITYPSDTTSPTVTDKTPIGTDIPVATKITITFSESMNRELAEDTFSIYPEVAGEFDWKKNMMIFKPSSNLDYDTRYVVGVGMVGMQQQEAMDLAGNRLSGYEWEFRTEPPNNPPNIPKRPSGPTSGYIGTSYSYSTSAEDPDGDGIKHTFDWSDGTTSETEFMDSGETASLSHDWTEPGEYHIRVKTTDDKGATSRWSELLIVTILAPTPTLSVSIFTNPVPSGEYDEIKVQVFSDGDPVAGANVYLSSTIGSLYPIEGETDGDGGFVSTYTAPLVSTTQRYTISAAAKKEGYTEGKDSVPNLIFVEQPPVTTPAPVVTPIPTPEETPTPAPTPPPSQPIVPIAIAAIAAVTVLIYVFKVRKPPKHQPEKEKEKPEPDEEEKQQYGSISASSDPDGAVVLLDGAYQGISAMRMDNLPIGPHVVVFAKFGYFKCEKKAIVNADQTTPVHCDLTEILEIKLKLSAEPVEIPADGKSKSTITIRIEDKNGIPIPVPEDVTIELGTNIGTIESPAKILAGRASVTVTLTSSTVKGTATVKAKAEFLKGSTTVEFLQST